MMNDPARTWSALLDVIEAIAALEDPSAESVGACLSAAALDIPVDVRKGIVVLELPPAPEFTGLAAAMPDLGPPIGLDVVSPPVAGSGGRPPWDSKRSVGHEIAGRRVWFGIEETGSVERLVSVSIRYDDPPGEHLPPEGREGRFRLTTTLGWCGGHGEAVLDAAGAIRRHDDRPVFVDARSQDAILARVDLSGSWDGAPVIRIAGRGRLERRSERNSSIPGAPRQEYVALVIDSLAEARIEGERGS